MTADDRVFIRIPLAVRRDLQRRARLAGDKRTAPGSLARELIGKGLDDGGVPDLVDEPCTEPLNVSLKKGVRDRLVAAAQRESARVGTKIDLATYARRCLYRGLELEAAPRKRAVGD